jgi:bacterioferritin-associated ferredoxin
MVSRCVCHKATFAEIKQKMEEHGLKSFEEGLAREWYGTNCGMCHDYIRKMLITGETSFRAGDIYIDSNHGKSCESGNRSATL